MRRHCSPDKGFESRPGCLRPSTLPLGHGGSLQYLIFTSERERKFFETRLPERGSSPRSPTVQAGRRAAHPSSHEPPSYAARGQCWPTVCDARTTPTQHQATQRSRWEWHLSWVRQRNTSMRLVLWEDGPTSGAPLWGHNGRRGTPTNLTIKTQTSSSSVESTVPNKSENSLPSCHVYLINMR